MPYIVSVDQDLCISSGHCVAEAPSAFRFTAEELAEAVTPSPEVIDERLLDIGRNCPSGAIMITDRSGTSLLD